MKDTPSEDRPSHLTSRRFPVIRIRSPTGNPKQIKEVFGPLFHKAEGGITNARTIIEAQHGLISATTTITAVRR
jgi:hypothetical protein